MPTANDLPLSGKSEPGGDDEQFLKLKGTQRGGSRIWTQVTEDKKTKPVLFIRSGSQTDSLLDTQKGVSQPFDQGKVH